MSTVQPSPSRLPTPSFLRRPISPSSSRPAPGNNTDVQQSHPPPSPKVSAGSGLGRTGSIADRAKIFERGDVLDVPVTPNRKSFGYYGGVRVDSPIRSDGGGGNRLESPMRQNGAGNPREEVDVRPSSIPSPTTSMPPPRVRPSARTEENGEVRKTSVVPKAQGLARSTSVRQPGDRTSRPTTTVSHPTPTTTTTTRSVSQSIPRTTSTRAHTAKVPASSSSSALPSVSRKPIVKNGDVQRTVPKRPIASSTSKPGVAAPISTRTATGRPRPISMYASSSTVKLEEVKRMLKRSTSATANRPEDTDVVSDVDEPEARMVTAEIPTTSADRSRSPVKTGPSSTRLMSVAKTATTSARSLSPAKKLPPTTRAQSPTKATDMKPPLSANIARKNQRHDSSATATIQDPSSKPSFNTFNVEYPAGAPVPKLPTTTILHSASSSKLTQTPQELLHMQTRLLQLSIIHEESFATLASWKKSAKTKLRARYEEAREKERNLEEKIRYEQHIVDLKGLEAILLPVSSRSSISRALDMTSPEEAIQALSETAFKLMGIFAEAPAPGDHTRLITQFETWYNKEQHLHVDGMGVEFSRDVTRVRRKLETGLRGLEGWEVLLQDDEAVKRSSLAATVFTLAIMARTGLEELAAIQALEKQVVADARRDLRTRLDDIAKMDIDGGWVKPAWM